MRKIALVFLTTIVAATSAGAECNPEKDPASCTVRQAFAFYRTQDLTAAVAEEVTTANRATEPPDPFAGRIHNSYQDFLNLLSFAINKVDESDDGQALTVRFNPMRNGSDVFGGTLTAAKPTISDAVKSKLPEEGRTDLTRQLEGQLGDADDLTFSLSWARQTEKCEVTRDPSHRCYGRDPATYRGWLSGAVAPLLTPDDADIDFDDVVALDAEIIAGPDGVRPRTFDANLKTHTRDPNHAIEAIKTLVSAEKAVSAKLNELTTKAGIANLASLIDNQPQFTSSLNYHDAGRYGGGPVMSASFELQFGNDNINDIRWDCAERGDSCFQTELAARLKTEVSTVKWVLTGSYIRNHSYKLTDLGGVTVPIGFLVDLPSSNVISIKGQGGRQLGGMMSGDKRMRADGSIEFERVTSNDNTARKNRFVAKGTLTVPLGKDMSVPLSITWANKEKFLGDQTDKFGMHVGISYRIPDLDGLFKKKP
jgi:hypothetical protein